jgi:hypothetical protein
MNATDTTQAIVLITTCLALGFMAVAWDRTRPANRLYHAPVISYLLVTFAYYVTVIFFREYTSGEGRMLWSAILRELSLILALLSAIIIMRAWPKR